METVIEKRERQVIQEYWYCGVTGNGHYHRTQKQAIKCNASRTEKPTNDRSEILSRKLKMLELRKSGKTFKYIGAAFNVGPSRASQLVYQAEIYQKNQLERERRNKQISELKNSCFGGITIGMILDNVSVRTSNAIKNAGISDMTIGDFLKTKESGFIKIPNLGRKMFYEVLDVVENISTPTPPDNPPRHNLQPGNAKRR